MPRLRNLNDFQERLIEHCCDVATAPTLAIAATEFVAELVRWGNQGDPDDPLATAWLTQHHDGAHSAVAAPPCPACGRDGVIQALLIAQAHEQVRVCRKLANTSQVRVRTDGTTASIALQGTYGVQRVDPSSGHKYWVQMSWLDYEWAEFFQVAANLRNQRDTLGQKLAAIDEVIKLRDRFPGSRTPREACEMAGIDPADIAI